METALIWNVRPCTLVQR